MSLFKKNSLAVALMSCMLVSVVALQGCGDDEQSTPATGGSGGKTSTGGSGGKTSTAGAAGKPVSEGGAAGEEEPSTVGGAGGAAGETSQGGAGGEGGAIVIPCDLSFDNSTLSVLTGNGGELPPLP